MNNLPTVDPTKNTCAGDRLGGRGVIKRVMRGIDPSPKLLFHC